MELSREIGEIKRDKGVAVYQPFRYNETIEALNNYSAKGGIAPDTLKAIFEIIHSESIRQQLRIVNNVED